MDSELRLKEELTPRFFRVPPQSFFLLGPRGTGKSTWLRHELRRALFIDLLRPEVFRELSGRPERLREMVRGSADRDTVVVSKGTLFRWVQGDVVQGDVVPLGPSKGTLFRCFHSSATLVRSLRSVLFSGRLA